MSTRTPLRWIIHVDMDAFYASIEQRDRPELRGKPVIVGGPAKSRGVVSAASYEAREYGVHSAMPSSQAERLCPQGVFLRVDMAKYVSVSRQVMLVLQDFSPLVEQLSVDEAFLDLTGTERLHASVGGRRSTGGNRSAGPVSDASSQAVEQIGWNIKDRIRGELDLTASLGLAPNKFLAKLSSDLEKPDGFVIVHHERVEEFLRPLPVEKLWGVGKATAENLRRMGIATVGALAGYPLETLRQRFGVVGEHLYRLAHGLDDRPVEPFTPAKSVSAETTFAEDTNDLDLLERTLLRLSEEVAARLRKDQLRGRTITVKIRFSDFKTITRNRTLTAPTCVTSTLYNSARALLAAGNPSGRKVRLLGVGLAKLTGEGDGQFSLFEAEAERDEKIEAAVDKVRQKFGPGAIRRGRLMG
ncbi:MAG: DNA polymerase IV [Armatimonadetes bacterium]|nr:DNA polymerase IV [Armatimonadota bacterium]